MSNELDVMTERPKDPANQNLLVIRSLGRLVVETSHLTFDIRRLTFDI
jgi:hypothetical protein